MASGTFYSFRDFVLDPDRRALKRGGEEIPMPERAFSVLLALVERSPEVVGKDELIDAGWPEVAVIEDNLVQAVHLIRSTLGGDSKNPRFVQTVHRKGYRFIAPVEVVQAPVENGAAIDRRTTTGVRSRRRRLVWVAVAAAFAVSAGGFLSYARNDHSSSTGRISSLAVLPLTDLSEGTEQEYFSVGMTDALITELARLDGLAVISRTSVMRYKTTESSVPKIARELGVEAIVEGTVTRAGDRVRVIAQLIDASDRHLWAESYEYQTRDVLRLQRRLAEEIATEIGMHVTPLNARSGGPVPRVEPAAHEANLKGRYCLGKRTEESMFRAIGLFDDAIGHDPDYGAAYAGLADCYNLLANYGFAPSTEARPRARRAAEQALELDPGLADAHAALAQIEAEYEWNFNAAEIEFRRSLALNPSNAQTHGRYAYFLVSQGRMDEALAEIEKAQRLNPLSDIISANVGWILMLDGQEEASEARFRQLLDFNPSFGVAQYYLGTLLERLDRHEEAIAVLRQACESTQDSDYARAALAHALAEAGQTEKSREILDDLLEQKTQRYVSPVALVVVHLGLGETDRAFDALEQAYVERKGWLLHMRYEPVFDDYRDDPRYLDLVNRIELP